MLNLILQYLSPWNFLLSLLVMKWQISLSHAANHTSYVDTQYPILANTIYIILPKGMVSSSLLPFHCSTINIMQGRTNFGCNYRIADRASCLYCISTTNKELTAYIHVVAYVAVSGIISSQVSWAWEEYGIRMPSSLWYVLLRVGLVHGFTSVPCLHHHHHHHQHPWWWQHLH